MIIRILLFAGIISTLAAQPFEPVNPRASTEVHQLMDYFYSLQGTKTISGQHFGNRHLDRYLGYIDSLTGETPAVWGTDFIWMFGGDPGERIVEAVKEKHKQGFIITLMWHVGRPMDEPPHHWITGVQDEVTNEQWEEFTTPGTDLHQKWLTQVDHIAGYLKELRDENIPILWRPYHEMNGVWFWWGDKKGEDGYQKLWKMMYDRYVNYHELNNLIWVWNANAPRDIPFDQAYDYHHYFPGHEYVDVLATDVYHFDYEEKDYQQLLDLAKGKLVALGEVGELPKTEILEVQPAWSWFMVWDAWIYTANKPKRVKNIYAHPQVLSKEEIDLPYRK